MDSNQILILKRTYNLANPENQKLTAKKIPVAGLLYHSTTTGIRKNNLFVIR